MVFDLAPQRQQDSHARHRLPAKRPTGSLPNIPRKLDWGSKKFTYIGPQVELLLCWPRDSWLTLGNLASRIRPLDREQFEKFCAIQSAAGFDYETEYSISTISGDYILVRDVVHIARNFNGEIESLMGFFIEVKTGTGQARRLVPDKD